LLVSDKCACSAELLEQFLVRLCLSRYERDFGTLHRRHYGRVGSCSLQLCQVVLTRAKAQASPGDFMNHVLRQNSTCLQRQHLACGDWVWRSLGCSAQREYEYQERETDGRFRHEAPNATGRILQFQCHNPLITFVLLE